MNLQQGKTLLQLIELLYSCVDCDSQWSVFLDALGGAFGGTLVGITTNAKLNVVIGVDPAELAVYQTYFSTINPWLGRRIYPEGKALLSQEVLPYAAYRTSTFYNEWGKKNQVTHAVGGAIRVHRNMMLFLSINRGDSQGPYDGDDCEMVQLLMPHVQRAANLHDQLMVMHDRQWVLDSLAFPVMHLSQDAALLWANRTAEVLLREGRALFLKDGKVRARTATDDSALQGMLREDRQILTTTPTGFGGWLRVVRPDDGSELSILVAHAPTRFRRFSGVVSRSTTFIIFVARQSVDDVLLVKRLRDTWGLTSAEAALALELLAAETLQEAAERLRVSRNTVRTQLASIYEKVGARRQSELLRKILAVAMIGCPRQQEARGSRTV